MENDPSYQGGVQSPDSQPGNDDSRPEDWKDPAGSQREPGVEQVPDDDVRTGQSETDPDDPDIMGDDASGQPS